jgi:hypothetical protein
MAVPWTPSDGKFRSLKAPSGGDSQTAEKETEPVPGVGPEVVCVPWLPHDTKRTERKTATNRRDRDTATKENPSLFIASRLQGYRFV